MKTTTAVYAGSFDPPTNGHLWVIQEAVKLFGGVVVAVGINPDKKSLFSLEDRKQMLKEMCAGYDNVTIDSFEGDYLINYTVRINATHILRGIRNESDYEYERMMRHVNYDLNPDISTVFLMPPREMAELSSSLVKGLVGPNGWRDIVCQYVPVSVYKRFIERFGKG